MSSYAVKTQNIYIAKWDIDIRVQKCVEKKIPIHLDVYKGAQLNPFLNIEIFYA